MNEGKRIRFIDEMQFLALLGVFFWHSSLFFEDVPNPFFPERAAALSGGATLLGRFFNVTLIAAFVVASGFLFALSIDERDRSVPMLIWVRVRRIIIPYYIVGSIWLVPLYTFFDISAFGRPEHAGLAEGYKCMLLGQFSENLWFLWMLFWVALFFILLKPLAKRRSLVLLFLLSLAAALATDLFLTEVPYFKISQTGPYFLCFFLGILIYAFRSFPENLRTSTLALLTLLLFLTELIYVFGGFSHFAALYIFRPAGGLLFLLFCLTLERVDAIRKFTISKAFRYLSDRRMRYYLICVPYNYLIFRFLMGKTDRWPILSILIIFVFSLAGVFCTAFVWEKMETGVRSLWRRSRSEIHG
ncbi:MAG: acyltransferase [Lachnospiraceae bacterium]|nr:acyltransferase [Lachnospiraceae bacterium]